MTSLLPYTIFFLFFLVNLLVIVLVIRLIYLAYVPRAKSPSPQPELGGLDGLECSVSVPSSVPCLPQEMIICILEKLSENQKTLHRCAMVCRTFYAECRRYRFYAINVYLTQNLTFHLHSALLKDQEIFKFIRKLRLVTPSAQNFLNDSPSYEFDKFLLQGLIEVSKDASADSGLRTLLIEKVDWFYLQDETKPLLITLIETSYLLHTVSLSICHFCDRLRCQIDMLRNLSQLRHLTLCGTMCRSCYIRQTGGVTDWTVVQVGDPQTKLISIETLKVKNASMRLIRHLFYPGCPLDLSQLKELHIDGLIDILSGYVFLGNVLRKARKSIESLIWEFSVDIEGLDFDIPLSGQPSQNIQLRHLTLHSPFIHDNLEVDKLFSYLQSLLGIQFDRLEVLNVVYASNKYINQQDEDKLGAANYALKRTLNEAEEQFKKFYRSHSFPNLGRINVLIGHPKEADEVCTTREKDSAHWIPSEDWTSSCNWPWARACAPTMHETGKLFLRTSSFSEGDINTLPEKFSLRNLK